MQKRLYGGEGCNRVYWSAADVDDLLRFCGLREVPSQHPLPPVRPTGLSAAPATSKTYRFTISTPSVDRMGDTIAIDGWHLDAYRKNPVVLWGHFAGSLPIGRATAVYVEGNRLIAEMRFSQTEEARAVQAQVDEGVLRATSVGFAPLKFSFARDSKRPLGIDFVEQELLEFSVVSVPANPEALLMGNKAAPQNARERARLRRERDLTLIRLRSEL